MTECFSVRTASWNQHKNRVDQQWPQKQRLFRQVAVGAIAGAAVGGAAGGIIGAMTDSGIPESDAHVYAEGVRRGGTLVTARVDEPLVGEAERILGQSRTVDVAARRRDYEAGGWTGFNPDAEPYNSEPERDRLRDLDRL